MSVAKTSLAFLCPLSFPKDLTNTSKGVRATSRCGIEDPLPTASLWNFEELLGSACCWGCFWGAGSVRVFAGCYYTGRKPKEKQTTHLPPLSNPGKQGETTFSITQIKEYFPPAKFESAANKPTQKSSILFEETRSRMRQVSLAATRSQDSHWKS